MVILKTFDISSELEKLAGIRLADDMSVWILFKPYIGPAAYA